MKAYAALYYSTMDTSKVFIYPTFEEAKRKVYEMFGEESAGFICDMAKDLRADESSGEPQKLILNWIKNFYFEENENFILISDDDLGCFFEAKECEVSDEFD